MRVDDAEIVALRALAWLAADEDLLRTFCGATGAARRDLEHAAEDPVFLAGILDFICLDDAWVTGFAAASGLSAEAPARARAALPGGDLPHWT